MEVRVQGALRIGRRGNRRHGEVTSGEVVLGRFTFVRGALFRSISVSLPYALPSLVTGCSIFEGHSKRMHI